MYNRIFIAAAALYSLVLWPILRADRFYIDDLGRSRSGYLGWGKDGRPLSNIVMEALNVGTPLTDISPLPQLLCIALFAYLAVLVAKRFELDGIWKAPLVVAPLVANPFFLENLSYKFDSLTMSLAVVLAAIAVLSFRAVGWRPIVAGWFILLASLCLYQPALNVFLIFVAVEFLFGQWCRTRADDSLRALTYRVLQVGAALVTYKLIAAATVRGNYASTQAVMAPVNEMGHTLTTNLKGFLTYALGNLGYSAGFMLSALMAFSLVAAVVICFRFTRESWGDMGLGLRLAYCASILATPAFMLIALWGPMLALKAPVFVPRTQIGIGALASAGMLLLALTLTRVRLASKWKVAVMAVPVYALVAFAIVYGNSLGLQKDYENRISAQIADDLAGLAQDRAISAYALSGNAGRPPVVAHNIKKFPVLKALVPVHLTEGWGWAGEQLKHFGVTAEYRVPPYDIPENGEQKASIVRSGYEIRLNGHVAIINFPTH